MTLNHKIITWVFFAAACVAVLPNDMAASEDVSALAQGDAVLESLKKIEERLKVIEENQQKILEGQQQLSEEHTQLRYWIHRN